MEEEKGGRFIFENKSIPFLTFSKWLLLATTYFFEGLLGFKSGLFPCVSLLSRRRLSTSPVDLAIGFGPGLRAIRFLLDVNIDFGCCRIILLVLTDTFNRHEMLDFS